MGYAGDWPSEWGWIGERPSLPVSIEAGGCPGGLVFVAWKDGAEFDRVNLDATSGAAVDDVAARHADAAAAGTIDFVAIYDGDSGGLVARLGVQPGHPRTCPACRDARGTHYVDYVMLETPSGWWCPRCEYSQMRRT